MDRQPVKFKSVTLTYNQGSTLAKTAVKQVDLTIQPGSLTMVVGPTGSGKSSLLYLLDGLRRPTSGQLQMGKLKIDPNSSDASLSQWRQHIGFVFQFPESQLFAETVLADIEFGPLNQGMITEQAEKRARRALHTVGLSQDLASRSPFTLSGGQKRRVAMAGVLAMNYQLLLLDEPLSGLDPDGKHYLAKLLGHLKKYGKTVLLITHDMELATLADEVIVMNHGEIIADRPPERVFADPDLLANNDLTMPPAVKMTHQLRQDGVHLSKKAPMSLDALAAELSPLLKERESNE